MISIDASWSVWLTWLRKFSDHSRLPNAIFGFPKRIKPPCSTCPVRRPLGPPCVHRSWRQPGMVHIEWEGPNVPLPRNTMLSGQMVHNISPTPKETRPSPKETIVFQPSIFKGELLVSGRVDFPEIRGPISLPKRYLLGWKLVWGRGIIWPDAMLILRTPQASPNKILLLRMISISQ